MTSKLASRRGSLRSSTRTFLSHLTYAGLVPPPPVFRPSGFSAFVIAKNEEDWAETSILPICDFVDEVVLANNGSEDATPDILRRLTELRPEKIRYLNCSNLDFVATLNRLVSDCRYRWILRWNADFVPRTSGPESLGELINTLRGLDPLRYYCVSLSGVALDGDLEHQFPARRDPPEPLVFTCSPWLRYTVRERWESLHVPWFYQKVVLRSAYYFHMRSVKSALRMLQKRYWAEWFERRTLGDDVSMEDFIADRALSDFGGSSVEEAAQRYVIEEFQGCLPFSREECGDYPDLLRPFLKNPPFRLVFEDGKIVGRIEAPRHGPRRGHG